MKTILALIYYWQNAHVKTWYNFGRGTYTTRRSIKIGGYMVNHLTHSAFRSLSWIKGSGFVFKVLNNIKNYI